MSADLPDVLGNLERLIDLRIEAKLRQLGALTTQPDPRALRVAKGIDVAALAARSGISHVTIGRLEGGKLKRPKPETLNSLARALGVPESQYRQAVAALLQNRGAA